jgi:diguanylate cyclase (GGDEF)-like protein
MIDQNSLFVAVGIAAAALSFALANAWLQARSQRFLISWSIGILLLGVGVTLSMLSSPANLALMALGFGLKTSGFVVVYLAARQFTGQGFSSGLFAVLISITVPSVALPFLLGFDGLALIVFNTIAAVLLSMTGHRHWRARAEAPSSLVAITILYHLTAASFLLCAGSLLIVGDLVLQRLPYNWAEQFNAVMCIAGITGIGSLSLGLNNARAADRHRRDAETDGLTGLANRRALFERYGNRAFAPPLAVAIFDLDHFKAVNDAHGHSVGDEVLRHFARTVNWHLGTGDFVARTGGEEFVLVMAATPQGAGKMAESIRESFAATSIAGESGDITCTVSAGIAVARLGGESFEEALQRADKSLYRAKQKGRDRVVADISAVA